jgi:NADH-quinone oxidoreductase subunit H
VLLFLGGWDLPIFMEPAVAEGLFGLLFVALKVGVFGVKIAAVLFLMMWVRWTLPRLRFDQLMSLAWRMLIPASILLVVVTGVVIYADLPLWWLPIANVVVFLLGAATSPLLHGPPTNRRVGLVGSRYSPA